MQTEETISDANASISHLNYSQRARYHLKSKWCYCALMTILYLIPFILPSLIGQPIGYLIQLLLAPLSIGFNKFYLRIAKGENQKFQDILFACTNIRIYFKALVLYFLSIFVIVIGFLLFIVPGFIAGMAFSQVYFIFVENPQLEILQIFKRSMNMMKGRKMKLLLQLLSFIGWVLLAILTLYIGFLWLLPYLSTTMTQFYIQAKSETEQVASIHEQSEVNQN